MTPKPGKRIKKRDLIKKADVLWSKVIRSGKSCQRCGKTDGLQAAHIISRKHFALRWDLLNGLCLCYACHLHWAHKEPLLFAEWVKECFPNRYYYLMQHKDELAENTDYQAKIDELKGLL